MFVDYILLLKKKPALMQAMNFLKAIDFHFIIGV